MTQRHRTTELVNKNPELMKAWLADIPAGRLCKVWELKGVYVFLASAASSFVTGSDYVVDGEFILVFLASGITDVDNRRPYVPLTGGSAATSRNSVRLNPPSDSM